MNILKTIALMILFIGLVSCKEGKEAGYPGDDELDSPNKPTVENIQLADPTIFQDGDTYYLYGTSQGELSERGDGFLVYKSTNLENWKGPVGKVDGGFALQESDAFGDQGFWAPQVFVYNNKYYVAYTANENIAIATSDSPLGPFSNSGEALEAPVKQIDPFVFFDDGKIYLYHVRLGEGNRIFVAEMNEELSGIKPETLTECISAKEPWENTENTAWPVAEGPTVLKRNDKYYLIYSANDFRNPDYSVGYATSDSPFGPWEKSENSPIIDKNITGENGSGHGDVIFDENGEMQYVLHTHHSSISVHPRKTAVIQLNFEEDGQGNEILKAEDETFTFLQSNKE